MGLRLVRAGGVSVLRPSRQPVMTKGMRIVVVDFAGHPFQYDLASRLAARGHEVAHTYCATLDTPQVTAVSAPHLTVFPVRLGRPFEKYHAIRRIIDELRYGLKTLVVAAHHRPTHMLVSNVPVVSLTLLWIWSGLRRIPVVLWLQDIQAGLAGMVVGRQRLSTRSLASLERFLIRRAARVIAISPEFREAIAACHVPATRVDLVENWAPLDCFRNERKRTNGRSSTGCPTSSCSCTAAHWAGSIHLTSCSPSRTSSVMTPT